MKGVKVKIKLEFDSKTQALYLEQTNEYAQNENFSLLLELSLNGSQTFQDFFRAFARQLNSTGKILDRTEGKQSD